MSSVFNDCTVACSAEMPFLIGFSDKNYKRVRDFVGSQIGYTGQMIYDFWAKEFYGQNGIFCPLAFCQLYITGGPRHPSFIISNLDLVLSRLC